MRETIHNIDRPEPKQKIPGNHGSRDASACREQMKSNLPVQRAIGTDVRVEVRVKWDKIICDAFFGKQIVRRGAGRTLVILHEMQDCMGDGCTHSWRIFLQRGSSKLARSISSTHCSQWVGWRGAEGLNACVQLWKPDVQKCSGLESNAPEETLVESDLGHLWMGQHDVDVWQKPD